jgi:hypothetical protein
MTWEQVVNDILCNINSEARNVLIQAGHFSLLFDERNKLIPAIMEEIDDPELKEFVAESDYMNDFPLKTLENSMPIAVSCRQHNKSVKFAFIVNDWQWINKTKHNTIDRASFFQ